MKYSIVNEVLKGLRKCTKPRCKQPETFNLNVEKGRVMLLIHLREGIISHEFEFLCHIFDEYFQHVRC